MIDMYDNSKLYIYFNFIKYLYINIILSINKNKDSIKKT